MAEAKKPAAKAAKPKASTAKQRSSGSQANAPTKNSDFTEGA